MGGRMNSTDDPVRLTALGSGAPIDLAHAIRGLRNEVGSDAMVRALEQRLLAELGPAALAGASSAPASCSSWLFAIVALSLAGSIFMPPPAQPASAVSSPRLATVTAVAAPPPVIPPTALAPPRVILDPRPSLPSLKPQPQPRRARRTPAARPQAIQPGVPQPKLELELLTRARAALHSHPAAALELAEQHASDYPHGLFAQEREILAIEALFKQHKRSLAFARAQQFIGGYNTSPYALRIQALLEQRPRGRAAPSLADANAQAEVAPRSGAP